MKKVSVLLGIFMLLVMVMTVSAAGNITVVSSPTGATIYLDNIINGITPSPLIDLPNGTHIISLQLSGYQVWAENFVVNDDNTPFNVTLVSLATTTATTSPTTTATTAIPIVNGTFSLTSSPSNANVYIDSALRGLTPLTLYNVTPDTYIVSIRKTGYVSYTKQFNVTAGNTTYVSASLTADATDSPTLASLTAAIAATTSTPTKKSTAKTYTPYPTATPTQKSPVPFELCGVAIALGLVLIRKKD